MFFSRIRRAVQEHRAKSYGTTVEKMEAYETARKNQLYRAKMESEREAQEKFYKQRAEQKYKAKLERGQRLKAGVKKAVSQLKERRASRMGVGAALQKPSPFSSGNNSPFSLSPAQPQQPRQRTIIIKG